MNSLDLYVMTVDNKCRNDNLGRRYSDDWKLIAISTSISGLKLKVANRMVQRPIDIESWNLFIVCGFADENRFFLPIRDEVLVVYDGRFVSPEEWISIKEKYPDFLDDILMSDLYVRLRRLDDLDDRKGMLDRRKRRLVEQIDYYKKEVITLEKEMNNVCLEKVNMR